MNTLSIYQKGYDLDFKHGISGAALPYYLVAAKGGNIDAANAVAMAYLTGRGITADMEKGLKWLALAADKGHPEAQCNMGVLYHQGNSLPHDPEQGNLWLMKAALQHEPNALRYLELLGVTPLEAAFIDNALQEYPLDQEADIRQSINLSEEDLISDDADDAAITLGDLAETARKLVSSNENSAEVNSLLDKAGKGEANADELFRIGCMFEEGEGFFPDFTQARRWFQKALTAGNNAAKGRLYRIYKEGYGVHKNDVKADAILAS